ncbi:XVIPCD domain-containing protein [Lysobacter sp. TAB13]|uniref:XVIPCD domain-containing protein n=1 Tax=Lysobacter sp. TAB13 TaxID=3233065 RepID=UPI003F9B2B47
MTDVRAEIRPLLEELSQKDGLPPSAIADLEATIGSSPYLANVMSAAIESGALKHLAIASNPHEAGRYEALTGTINLDPDNFDSDQWRGAANRRDNLAVVLGHETGHALLGKAQMEESYRFDYDVTTAIREASRDKLSADLTEPAGRYMEFMRRNEALAELVGMNSLASRTSGGRAESFNRQDFLHRADPSTPCVDNGVLAKGIALSQGGIQLTGKKLNSPAVEAVAYCYTDSGSSLGQHGDSGYRAYYGSGVMETIYEAHRDYAKGTSMHVPDIELDMAKLQLDPRKIERVGLDLDGKGNSFSYIDISHGRYEREAVTHTSPDSKPSHQPREATASVGRPADRPVRADQPQHPDYQAFDTIRSAVRADGRWNEEQSANIAADLLRAHKADPLSPRLDQVYIGNPTGTGQTNVFAVYAPHGNRDPMFYSHVDADVSAQIPAQRSLDQVEQINRQQAQERAQARQQAESQSQAGPGRSHPH